MSVKKAWNKSMAQSRSYGFASKRLADEGAAAERFVLELNQEIQPSVRAYLRQQKLKKSIRRFRPCGKKKDRRSPKKDHVRQPENQSSPRRFYTGGAGDDVDVRTLNRRASMYTFLVIVSGTGGGLSGWMFGGCPSCGPGNWRGFVKLLMSCY